MRRKKIEKDQFFHFPISGSPVVPEVILNEFVLFLGNVAAQRKKENSPELKKLMVDCLIAENILYGDPKIILCE